MGQFFGGKPAACIPDGYEIFLIPQASMDLDFPPVPIFKGVFHHVLDNLTVWKYTDSGKEYSITDPEFIRSIQSSLISSELLEGIGDYYYPLDNYSLDIIATAASEEGNRDLTVYTDADTVQKIKTFLDLE